MCRLYNVPFLSGHWNRLYERKQNILTPESNELLGTVSCGQKGDTVFPFGAMKILIYYFLFTCLTTLSHMLYGGCWGHVGLNSPTSKTSGEACDTQIETGPEN